MNREAGEKGLMMRKLLWAGGLLALLWSAYWAVGTYAVRTGVAQGVDQALRDGVISTPPTVAMTGFPTRFALAVQGIDAGDPRSGLRWQTPSLQLEAALWRPWRVVALLDDENVLTLPGEQLSLTADDARASLTVTPDGNLTLSQFAITLTQPVVQSSNGWRSGGDIAEMHVNLLPAPAPANSYAIVLDATNIGVDPAIMTATGLDGTIAKIMLDGTATFSAPLDRMARQTQPQITGIALTKTRVAWGAVQMTAAGTVTADTEGFAAGRIDIEITGWRSLVGALVGTGTITPEAAPTVEGLLGAMAAQGGNPDVLVLPLIFANGRGSLGPLPLGAAPRMQQMTLN